MSDAAKPTEPADDPSEILQAVWAEFGRRSLSLAFLPGLERRYRAAIQAGRLKQCVAFGLVATLIYDLFLPIAAPLIPDMIGLGLVLQLGILTPFSLANIMVMLWRRRVIVSTVAATIALPMLATLAIFALSRAPGAVFLPLTVPAFVMCASFSMPLPFPYVCAMVALAALALPAALLCHPGYGAAELKLTLMLNYSLYVFTLAAARRMEINERASYLLNLRESLRADILTQNNERLRALSDTDGLTGIKNRRYLDATLDRLWRDAAKDASSVGMLLIDIDHFKAFNDTYGHQVGDACLLVVADLLAEHTRLGTDIAARFGGEEFAVLMPGASLSRAVAVGERLREAVESLSVPLDGASCSVRISVGCASLVADSQSPPACLITAADEALYCAKRTGRNRTHPAAFVE